jgi:hypothetical protein
MTRFIGARRILFSGARISLYAFTTATFGAATGIAGPSLAQARTGLTGTGTDTWKNNTEYFNTSSGVQLWTVPETGTYRITAQGAGAGQGTRSSGQPARMRGDFSLIKGEVIRIVVGQAGLENGTSGGGGGGTFVVRTPFNTNGSILLIAGGAGGGPGDCCGGQLAGGNASTSTSGTQAPDPGGVVIGTPGIDGNGGTVSSTSGAGGGFFTNGVDSGGSGGYAFVNGSTGGGGSGGFGGGGGSSTSAAGGGGGGYSGGANANGGSNWGGGGGGGSYNNGTNQVNVLTGVTSSIAGSVIITKL